MRWRIRLLACLSLSIAGLLAGISCRENSIENQPEEAHAGASLPLPRTEQHGASQRAWLGGKGNAGDSGCCSARLKLPLSHEPAWEWSYSAAEFSDANLNSLLHYDGRLFTSAYCPQIAVLNTTDGRQLDNSVRYAPLGGGLETGREYFTSMYLNPNGLLLGCDNLGRRYCWQASGSELALRWLRSGKADKNFLGVPVPGLSIATFNEGLEAMKLEDGSRAWGVPVLLRNRRFRDNSNMVASDSGRLLWCSGYGDMEAFDGASGKPLWAAAGVAAMRNLALDPAGEHAYIAYQNELLECRSLEDGRLLWDFDWSAQIPEQERAALQAEMGPEELYRARVAGLSASADSVVLSLYNGYCFSLSSAGTLQWKLRSDSMLYDALLLENAVLLTQFAAIPRSEQRRLAQGDKPLLLPPWPGLRSRLKEAQIDVPDYQPGQLNLTYFAGQLGGVALAVRVAALDPVTGAELDSHEYDIDFRVGPVPAYNMLVAGGGRRLGETFKASSKEPRILQAFDWLEWEGT
ncbi:PQQ-binding-like beta-propeller repeat protein [bacterium]|nr:PQQ-binding-like beta-propeller repeat protein [bacterium]